MRTHPEEGHRLVADVTHRDVAAAVLYHHERMDGDGYPFGIDGRSLPVTVKIIQVADAFDAMTSIRPYQAALPSDIAVSEIARCAGSQFDPDVETEVLAADLATGAFADLDRERLGADLGAVVARRAGRLSRAVAERWESDPEAAPLLDEAPGVWTHDHATVDRVRSAVAAWVGDLPAIVFQATGARRMWRRRRTMLGAAVLRRVFDPDAELSGREQRLLARAPDAVSAARSLLADELGRALAVDADRFLDLVGQGIPDGVLDRLNVPEAM